MRSPLTAFGVNIFGPVTPEDAAARMAFSGRLVLGDLYKFLRDSRRLGVYPALRPYGVTLLLRDPAKAARLTAEERDQARAAGRPLLSRREYLTVALADALTLGTWDAAAPTLPALDALENITRNCLFNEPDTSPALYVRRLRYLRAYHNSTTAGGLAEADQERLLTWLADNYEPVEAGAGRSLTTGRGKRGARRVETYDMKHWVPLYTREGQWNYLLRVAGFTLETPSPISGGFVWIRPRGGCRWSNLYMGRGECHRTPDLRTGLCAHHQRQEERGCFRIGGKW